MSAGLPYEFDWVTVIVSPFLMGHRQPDGMVRSDEMPQSSVELATFEITRTPVTNRQYALFIAATGHQPPGHWEGSVPPEELADHPVTYVDWYDAQAFCAWAGVRLPSEAEWEKAARGIDGRVYPWGEQAPDITLAYFDHANDLVGTVPVGSCPAGASPHGALDMSGNVWEWVSSLYGPYPYRADDGREDLGAAGRRVLRGGSSRSEHARYLHCAFRSMSYPSRRRDHIGFRVAR